MVFCSWYVRTNGRIDGGDWSADICVNYTNHHIQVDACRRLYIRMVLGLNIAVIEGLSTAARFARRPT